MFAPSTYAARRAALADRLSGLIVLLGNENAPMNYAGNIYAFRQDGSFLYYAGLDEPGLALALDADSGEATLYGHDPTMADTIWEGEMASIAERASGAGIARTAPPEALEDAVRAARESGREVHVLPPYRGEHTLKLASLLGAAPEAVEASRELIDAVIAQRLIKTDEEVAEIEKAVAVAVEMHHTAMRMAQPGQTEYEIAAAMEAVAAGAGGFTSFPLIVTKRGETLHNHATGAVLQEGDLLLHDGGAAAPSRYVSDLTRVSPVGGTFSDRQRSVYTAVLAAQEAALEACAPGALVPRDPRPRRAHDHRAPDRDGPDERRCRGRRSLWRARAVHAARAGPCDGLRRARHGRARREPRWLRRRGDAQRAVRHGQPPFRTASGGGPRDDGRARLLLHRPAHRAVEGRGHATPTSWTSSEAEKWVGLGGVRIEDDIVITASGHRVLGPPLTKAPEAVEAMVRSGA